MRALKLLNALFLLFPLSSFATTLPRLPLDDLYKNADVVAVVQIESGSIVEVGERACGIRYSGRVVESIKGPYKKSDTVEFGPYSGRGIGDSALVFLNRSDNVYSPKTSTNSTALAQEAAYRETCLSKMPKYSIMFDGFGFLEISWTTKFDYKEAVLFKDRWIASPGELERKLREPGDNQIKSDEYWVKANDVVTYLRNLGVTKSANP